MPRGLATEALSLDAWTLSSREDQEQPSLGGWRTWASVPMGRHVAIGCNETAWPLVLPWFLSLDPGHS